MPKTDRKSTRLNSSHLVISYAVFCLKKKKTKKTKTECLYTHKEKRIHQTLLSAALRTCPLCVYSYVTRCIFFFFFFFFFFFNDTATTEIYTLSLHDALPI